MVRATAELVGRSTAGRPGTPTYSVRIRVYRSGTMLGLAVLGLAVLRLAVFGIGSIDLALC